MESQPCALLGSLVADAVAMPAHWYYDRAALLLDYGKISGYCRGETADCRPTYDDASR